MVRTAWNPLSWGRRKEKSLIRGISWTLVGISVKEEEMTQQFQVKATSFLYLKYATNLRNGIPAELHHSTVATVEHCHWCHDCPIMNIFPRIYRGGVWLLSEWTKTPQLLQHVCFTREFLQNTDLPTFQLRIVKGTGIHM